jgi:hypothetical protein
MKNGRTEVKMITKTHKKDEKAPNRPDSKPEKLANIMYEGIVRYTKAKCAQTREKNRGFAVDFSGDRRVTVRTKDC